MHNTFYHLLSSFSLGSAKRTSTDAIEKICSRIALGFGIATITLSSCSSTQVSPNEVSISSESEASVAETSDSPSDALELQFGLYTADKPTALVQQFRPVLNVLETRMSESLGKPVEIEMRVDNTYEKGINSLVNGEVDFSQLGPASYVEAKSANPDLSILAVENKGGTKVFYGIICVGEDSSIESVGDIQGRNFAFGSELSTIGRFLSQQYLLTNGIKAADLNRYEYLGRHDKVGAAVGLGEFDAGALKEGAFKKLVANGTPIRELARFPNVTKPWVASSELPEEIEAELRQALLSLDDSIALEALGKDGFLEGRDRDFAPIREAIENNDAFFE